MANHVNRIGSAYIRFGFIEAVSRAILPKPKKKKEKKHGCSVKKNV